MQRHRNWLRFIARVLIIWAIEVLGLLFMVSGLLFGPAMLIGGLVIGSLYPVNSWDYPTYMVIAILAICFFYWRREGWSLTSVGQMGVLAAALFALSLFAYWPFWANFGTGYAGVGLLKGLPVHGMKVDRTFVHDVPDRAEAVAGAEAIVALAGALGKDLIVEGVETREQLAFFRQRDCRVFQGYLFSEPLSRRDFETAAVASERFAVA